jgi:hypothetical protein
MKPLRLNKGSADRTKRDMVEFVNSHFPEYDDPAVSIREILDSSDVVFGLWQDPEEPDGVGMYVIKGKNLMREIVASDQPAKVVMTAVCHTCRKRDAIFSSPCRCARISTWGCGCRNLVHAPGISISSSTCFPSCGNE